MLTSLTYPMPAVGLIGLSLDLGLSLRLDLGLIGTEKLDWAGELSPAAVNKRFR